MGSVFWITSVIQYMLRLTEESVGLLHWKYLGPNEKSLQFISIL